MKFGPKEIKELNEYLRTGRNRKREFLGGGITFASDLTQPEPKREIVEIDAFNRFNRLYGKADGGRIPFNNGSEALSKKEKIAQGLEKGRVSGLVDTYTAAVNVFNKKVDEAFDQYDASKLPKSFKNFLEEIGLKQTTYISLKNKLPFIPTTSAAELRTRLASSIINEANKQPKFIALTDLLKDANFTDKEYNVVVNDKSLLKLDTAEDKIKRAYNSIFRAVGAGDKNIKEFFNPRELISQITGLRGETISKKFNLEEYVGPNAAKLYRKLSNNRVQKAIINAGQDFTLDSFTKKMDSLGSQAKAQKVRKERLDKATKLAGEGVSDINAAQDEAIALLNKFYKDNPQELLNNTKLRNILDLKLNEDGEIVKKNKYVTDEDFLKLIKDKKGLFTKDHVDEVQFEKLSTEFPIFKQLATYNTNSGIIKSIKAYVAKNQNSKDPVVQDKIKKQIEFLEDLKLRIDTPTGRVGSKEVLAAVDRQAGTLPNFLAQLRALNIKLPAKAKAALLGTGGGLAATTLAAAGPIEETGSTAMDTAKTVGAATAGAATVGTKKGRNILSKAFRTLGTPLSGATFAANQIRSNIKAGENVADAVLDPLVGLELSFPGLFKENLAKITSNPTAQKILRLGKFGRVLTPIGAGITAAGLGVDAAKFTKKRIDELRSMTPEQRAELRRQGEAQAFDAFQAAGGGIAKQAGDRSGPPPEKGPNSQGLPGLLKRVRNL